MFLAEDIRQQEDNSLDSAEQQQMPQGEHEESHGNCTEALIAEQENPRSTDDGMSRAALDGSPLKDPGDASVREHQTGSDIISSETPEAVELHSLENSTQFLAISQKNSRIQNDEGQKWKSDWDGEEKNELLEWRGAFPQSPEGKVKKAIPICTPVYMQVIFVWVYKRSKLICLH